MAALVVVVASVAAPLAALGSQLTPCWAALVRLVVPAAASSAALDLQQTSGEVALVALQWVWPELWLDPQQTSGEAAPLVMVASVAASLAAQDPQLTPDGATLVALVVGNHRQALYWATLMTLEH